MIVGELVFVILLSFVERRTGTGKSKEQSKCSMEVKSQAEETKQLIRMSTGHRKEPRGTNE
jgi:hypothetical protein